LIEGNQSIRDLHVDVDFITENVPKFTYQFNPRGHHDLWVIHREIVSEHSEKTKPFLLSLMDSNYRDGICELLRLANTKSSKP
jgi:hypothetical protein